MSTIADPPQLLQYLLSMNPQNSRGEVSTDLAKICHCIVFFPSYNTTQIQRKNIGSSWFSFTQHVFVKPYVQGRITPVIWEGSLDPNGIAFWKGELRLRVYTKLSRFSRVNIQRPQPTAGGARKRSRKENRSRGKNGKIWSRDLGKKERKSPWARKKRKNHEEGNPIRKVACRFKKMEAQEPRTGQFEASFLSVQKVTLGIVRHWPLPVGDRFRHAVAWWFAVSQAPWRPPWTGWDLGKREVQELRAPNWKLVSCQFRK